MPFSWSHAGTASIVSYFSVLWLIKCMATCLSSSGYIELILTSQHACRLCFHVQLVANQGKISSILQKHLKPWKRKGKAVVTMHLWQSRIRKQLWHSSWNGQWMHWPSNVSQSNVRIMTWHAISELLYVTSSIKYYCSHSLWLYVTSEIRCKWQYAWCTWVQFIITMLKVSPEFSCHCQFCLNTIWAFCKDPGAVASTKHSKHKTEKSRASLTTALFHPQGWELKAIKYSCKYTYRYMCLFRLPMHTKGALRKFPGQTTNNRI